MKAGDHVTLEQLEIEHIRRTLESTDGIGAAADWLGIDRGTLRKKIEKYRINYMKYARAKPPEPNLEPSSNGHPSPHPALLPGDADGETSTDD